MAFPLTALLGSGGDGSNPFSSFGKVAGALGGAVVGLLQRRKAARLERRNPLPLTSADPNIVNNVGLAEQMAQTGLSDRVYNNALTNLNTGLSAGTRAIGRMGGTSSVASTLRAFNQGVNNLAAQDQAAQQSNQRLLMQQRGALAAENQRVFNWNKAQPYLAMQQRIASLRNAGNQNIFGGLGALTTFAGSGGGRQQSFGYLTGAQDLDQLGSVGATLSSSPQLTGSLPSFGIPQNVPQYNRWESR